MTKLLFIFLVLISTSAQSKINYTEQEDLLLAKLSTTREIINKESLEWDNKFYDSLINDDDPNIQILGYKEKLNPIKSKGKSIDYIDIASSINDLLTNDSLSPKSLKNILELCSYSKMQPYCHDESLNQKLFESMPNNAFIFLRAIGSASQDNNFDEVERLINDMANSKYIDIFYYGDPDFQVKLENYIKDNPFPKIKLEFEALSLKQLKSSDDKSLTLESMNEIMVFTYIIGNKLANSIPSFRNVLDVCKNNLNLEAPCLKIAEIFIHHSKSVISKHVGFAIKAEVLKQNNQLEELKIVEENKKSFKENYECLSKIMSYGPLDFIKDKRFNDLIGSIDREFGKLVHYKALAKLNYEYFLKQGDKEIMNPDQCNKNTSE